MASSLEWNQSILDPLGAGLILLDSRRRIVFANQSALSILGLPKQSVIHRRWESLPWRYSTESLVEMLSLNSVEEQLVDFQPPQKPPRLLSVEVHPIAADDTKHFPATSNVVIFRDATKQESYRAEMEHLLARIRNSREEIQHDNQKLQLLMHEDTLTTCLNRRCLDGTIQSDWDDHAADDAGLACLMIDIDHFKRLNDEHGHATGDEALRQIGACLRECFIGFGQVYRYGGEEFCVLLPKHRLHEATWIAKRVQTTIASQTIVSESHQEALSITVSIGVTDANQGGQTPQEMVSQADKCLYLAKRRGRNRVIAWTEEVSQQKFRCADRPS